MVAPSTPELPSRTGAFPGTVGATVHESTPWWPAPRAPGGPNVIVVVLDDVGFAQLGCYGSSIATPRMDALAANGLRYTNFHVTALCSPTRACLLTGRNHHAVGMGCLANFDSGYPGYRGMISPRAATLAEMMGENGYHTYASGKWHLAQPGRISPAGPFDQWPTQRGFDRYYGFLWGEDDQWTPELWYDQHRVTPDASADYHLSSDLTARAIEFLSDHVSAAPEDPFFLYLAYGACHAPHQAPRSFIDRYRGAFDHGWDEERNRVLRRQIDLGIVPAGTALVDRNPGVQAWDELGDDERRLYARMQEVFAGFMTHTDDQIGVLIDFLERYGILDDTLVILLSDNGASGEGGQHGTANEYRTFLGLPDSMEDGLAVIDELGGRSTHNHYPAGWAQAGNTPLKFYKKHTYGGGVRAPLIMHWPNGLDTTEPLRHQFHHATDVLPTITDVTATPIPQSFRGVAQLPVHGTSMAYTFSDPASPSRRGRQYFETVGHRGMIEWPWKAVADHEPGRAFGDDRWRLYNLAEDFSEVRDRSDQQPEILERLREAWWEDARAYDVLPLDDRLGERVQSTDPSTDRTRYRLLSGARLPNSAVGPRFAGRPFRVTAFVTLDSPDQGGVLLAYGRRATGFSFYLLHGILTFDYNLGGRHTVVRSERPVPLTASRLQLIVEEADDQALVRLCVDGDRVAESPVPRLIPGGLGGLTTQCGHNSPSAVSAEYASPCAFDGVLDEVVIELDPVSDDDGGNEWDAALAQQ